MNKISETTKTSAFTRATELAEVNTSALATQPEEAKAGATAEDAVLPVTEAKVSQMQAVEETLDTVLSKAKKRKMLLAEVEEMFGCECIETAKTYALVKKMDDDSPVICIPKWFLLNEYDTPLRPVGFRKIGDMMETINLPVPATTRSLCGIWLSPSTDENASLLERKGRFIVTLPRAATHTLNRFNYRDVRPHLKPYEGDVNDTMQSAWFKNPEIIRFRHASHDEIFFIAPLDYVNVEYCADVDDAEDANFVEEARKARRQKYVAIAERDIRDEVRGIAEERQRYEDERRREAERKKQLEAEFPELMAKVNEVTYFVTRTRAAYPSLLSKLKLGKFDVDTQKKTVTFCSHSYRITKSGVESLQEALATAERRLEKLLQFQKVAREYRDALSMGDFPVLIRDFYATADDNFAVPVLPTIPRRLRASKFSRRLLVRLLEDHAEIWWTKNEGLLSQTGSMKSYSYENDSHLQRFGNDMEELMKKVPYRFYKRQEWGAAE